MNTHHTDTAQETAHLEKLRAQLSTDIEAIQQKEASLKEYEQRLRLLMDHNRQGQPAPQANQVVITSGPNSQAALDAEWEKYSRAHALLEAARRGLTDDRLALKDREEKLHQREKDVARREAWVKAREQELAAAAAAKAAPRAEDSTPSFVTSPFKAASKLLKPKKPKPAA
jgi:uncharacterized protein (DUF3084 family)